MFVDMALKIIELNLKEENKKIIAECLGELLNFIFLFVQFFATDIFLNYKFRMYGWNVVQYYSYSKRDRYDAELGIK